MVEQKKRQRVLVNRLKTATTRGSWNAVWERAVKAMTVISPFRSYVTEHHWRCVPEILLGSITSAVTHFTHITVIDHVHIINPSAGVKLTNRDVEPVRGFKCGQSQWSLTARSHWAVGSANFARTEIDEVSTIPLVRGIERPWEGPIDSLGQHGWGKPPVHLGWGGTFQRYVNDVANQDAILAILPTGTANLLANDLNIPIDLKGAVGVVCDRQCALSLMILDLRDL
jgi:hypothetical protein